MDHPCYRGNGNQQPSLLEDLPTSVLTQIVGLLPAGDLLKFGLCSSSAQKFAMDPLLWLRHLDAEWGPESAAAGIFAAKAAAATAAAGLFVDDGDGSMDCLKQEKKDNRGEVGEVNLAAPLNNLGTVGSSSRSFLFEATQAGQDVTQPILDGNVKTGRSFSEAEHSVTQDLSEQKAVESKVASGESCAPEPNRREPTFAKTIQETTESLPFLVFVRREKFLERLRASQLRWPQHPSPQSAVDEGCKELRPLLEGCLDLLYLSKVSSSRQVAAILFNQLDILGALTNLNRALVQTVFDMANRDNNIMRRLGHAPHGPPFANFWEFWEVFASMRGGVAASQELRFPLEACLLLYGLSCRLLALLLKRSPLLCAARLHRTLNDAPCPQEEFRLGEDEEQDYPLQGYPQESLGGSLVRDLESVRVSYRRPDLAKALGTEASNALSALYLLPAAAHSARAQGLHPSRPIAPLKDWRNREWPCMDEEHHRRWIGHMDLSTADASSQEPVGSSSSRAESPHGLHLGGSTSRAKGATGGGEGLGGDRVGRPLTVQKAFACGQIHALTVLRERLLGKWQGHYMYSKQGEGGSPDPGMTVTIFECDPVFRPPVEGGAESQGMEMESLNQFAGFSLKGRGQDGIGPFLIDGTLRPTRPVDTKHDAALETRFSKTYNDRENRHTWDYYGLLDPIGMYGMWGHEGIAWSGTWTLSPVSDFTLKH